MIKAIQVFFLGMLACTASMATAEDAITAGTITTADGAEEFVTIIRPEPSDHSAPYPILFSPGSRDYPGSNFFWGDTPEKLGWLIVQTEKVYRGTSAELKAIMDAAKAKLEREGFEIADSHLISWSASSSAGARHAATLGADLRSVSFIPGYGGGRAVEGICAHHNLRVNFITGSRDTSWLRGAERMRDSLEACGSAHVSFTVIENGGHVLREISGEPLFTVLNAGRDGR